MTASRKRRSHLASALALAFMTSTVASCCKPLPRESACRSATALRALELATATNAPAGLTKSGTAIGRTSSPVQVVLIAGSCWRYFCSHTPCSPVPFGDDVLVCSGAASRMAAPPRACDPGLLLADLALPHSLEGASWNMLGTARSASQ